jgi:hypothetical protein
MSGTRFDKFFCEEFAKKLKKTEEIEEIVAQLK